MDEIDHEFHVRNAHKKVKFNQTEIICPYLLFVSHGVLGATSLPKRTKFNKVNLENQLPKPSPPM